MITVAERASGDARHDVRTSASASLLDAVTDLRRDVAATGFPLDLPGVPMAEARRRQLLDQLDDHLLPRLRELSSPAVVVVAGSTGAGKSTLVNSVLGTEVSAAGVLRPTTRRPVLAHHPEDADLLAAHPLVGTVEVVEHRAVPRGLALVDAPDLDSVLLQNREVAHRLLESADLWVFVTTATRYGDALPWDVLTRAAERGTSMAMVLNRVPQDALAEVRGDLMARLRSRGLAAVPLFLVTDLGPHEGLLEQRTVAPIQRWLTMVAGPDRARSVISRTQRGALRALRPWVDELAEAVQAQVDARAQLEGVLDAAVAGPQERAVRDVEAGSVADGPVRSRWSALSGRRGALAGRLGSRRGREARRSALTALGEDVEAGAVVVLRAARERSRTAVAEALAGTTAPGASGLLQAVESAAHAGAEALPIGPQDAAPGQQVSTEQDSARDWMAGAGAAVQELTSDQDRRRARRARRLVGAVGEEGVAVLVATAAAGLDGARRLLTDTLGEDVAAVDRVRADLVSRAREHAGSGAEPARAALGATGLSDDAAATLRLRLAVLKGLT